MMVHEYDVIFVCPILLETQLPSRPRMVFCLFNLIKCPILLEAPNHLDPKSLVFYLTRCPHLIGGQMGHH